MTGRVVAVPREREVVGGVVGRRVRVWVWGEEEVGGWM